MVHQVVVRSELDVAHASPGHDLRDAVGVLGVALPATEPDDGFDLGLGHVRTLHAPRLPHRCRQEQHVAEPDQLVGPALIEHDARVCLRRRRERDAARDVRFDQPGDDVDRRPLRRNQEVDADRTSHLRDAADRVFHVARRDHHQVGQLVDDDEDVRHLFGHREPVLADAPGAHGFVVRVDLALAVLREVLVAVLHLTHDPAQRIGRALRVRDHRRE